MAGGVAMSCTGCALPGALVAGGAGVVGVVLQCLEELADGTHGWLGLTTLYELTKLAHDPGHKIFTQANFDLMVKLRLVGGTLDAPTMHDSWRNVVSCAVQFDKDDIPFFVDPVQRT